MELKYKNPPINELIIGVYFDQPIALLRSEHIGLFWSEIKKDFPKVQQQPELNFPLAGPSITIQFGIDEAVPMPRYWFISQNDDFLIQIQKNAFIVNWRKRHNEYPHFDSVKAEFDKYFNKYSSFVKYELNAEMPNIQIAELVYSNLIEYGDYWRSAGDISSIVPSISMPNVGLEDVDGAEFNYLTSYKLGGDLRLNFSARSARKASSPSESSLVLEFRALGALGAASKDDADAWYVRAHEAIGHCFTAVTNPDIQQRYWQPM